MNHIFSFRFSKFTQRIGCALLLGSILYTTSPEASAQGVWTTGHGDFGIEYNAITREFIPTWGLDPGALVDGEPLPLNPNDPQGYGKNYFSPGSLVAFADHTTTTSSANLLNALGLSGSSTVYRLGNNNFPPNLGLAANGIGDESQWLDNRINITLTGFSGPGQMAISSNAGGSIVLLSSRGESYTQGFLDIGAGDHVHYPFWFTEAGYYELTLTWTGHHTTDGTITGNGTFGIHVGTIPEPTTWALIGVGLAGLLIHRRRRAFLKTASQ